MKVKLKTNVLKNLVSKSIKGCSNDKTLPLTSLMTIELVNHELTLITTDATNYLYMSEDKVEGDDFYVVVTVDTFAKLVSKTTSEYITLELKEDNLVFTGNGKYTIELPLDEEGRLIRFPDPASKLANPDYSGDVQLSTIKTILGVNRAALSTSLEVPCYTGYYFGESVVSTDTYKICGTGINVFEKSVLLSPEMMNLFECMSDEKIEWELIGNDVVFNSPSCTIYGPQLEGIEEYKIDAITELLDQSFESVCKLPKTALLQVLDRLALFVGVYDKNSITLTFTDKGLMISSLNSSGSELINYQDSQNFRNFVCNVDIEMLTSQIKAQPGEVVELWYGDDSAIKLVVGNIKQIIALAEDDE